MKKYKILVTALLLKNNKMAAFGDEVTEGQLTDTAKNLTEQGYIVEVKEDSSSEEEHDQTHANVVEEDAADGSNIDPDQIDNASDELNTENETTENGVDVDQVSEEKSIDTNEVHAGKEVKSKPNPADIFKKGK